MLGRRQVGAVDHRLRTTFSRESAGWRKEGTHSEIVVADDELDLKRISVSAGSTSRGREEDGTHEGALPERDGVGMVDVPVEAERQSNHTSAAGSFLSALDTAIDSLRWDSRMPCRQFSIKFLDGLALAAPRQPAEILEQWRQEV